MKVPRVDAAKRKILELLGAGSYKSQWAPLATYQKATEWGMESDDLQAAVEELGREAAITFRKWSDTQKRFVEGPQPSEDWRKWFFHHSNFEARITSKGLSMLEKMMREEPQGSVTNMAKSADAASLKKVFVVHGRNAKANKAMFDFLRSIGLEPIEWGQAIAMTGKGSPYIGEVLEHAFKQARAVVVLFTGDDHAKLDDRLLGIDETSEPLQSQPRPNVLFEAGMAFGVHADRTILVELGPLRGLSDIAGRHAIRLSNGPESRAALVARLKRAGCVVDTDGKTDWYSTGDFDGAVLLPTPSPAAMPVGPGKSLQIHKFTVIHDRRDDLNHKFDIGGELVLKNLLHEGNFVEFLGLVIDGQRMGMGWDSVERGGSGKPGPLGAREVKSYRWIGCVDEKLRQGRRTLPVKIEIRDMGGGEYSVETEYSFKS